MLHICFMEILVSIQQYLDGNLSYTDAVKLYNEIGTNSALKKVFATGEDDYSVNKLTSEFKALISKLKPEKSTSFQSFTVPKNNNAQLPIDKFSPELRTAYHRLSPIIREMAMLHAKLPEFQTDAERFECASKIYKLSRERRTIWDRVDYFKEHGVDHPMFKTVEKTPEQVIEIDLSKAKKNLNLLRTQRTKLRGKTHRLADFERVCTEISLLEIYIKNYSDAV